MTDIPRRTIQELLYLYEIEHSIKDIFVEGEYDCTLISQFLVELGKRDVVVRTIDCIDVDSNEIRRDGRDVGNRERVIFLAKEASRRREAAGRILCIADRDFGNWLGNLPEIRDLAFTDYASMDMYAWNRSVIVKFLNIYCNRPDWTFDQFVGALQTPLSSMFAIRLSARALGLELKWINRTTCIEIETWTVTFDINEFVDRLLHKNNEFNQKDEFIGKVDYYYSQFFGDPRYFIHAHDFTRLVAYFFETTRHISQIM